MALPLCVCIKGENGHYLSAKSIEGRNYLEFSSDDIGDPTVRHTIYTNRDGTIHIKSDHFGKFWRRGRKWIWADSDDATSNNGDTLFRLVKVGDIYSLQNLGNKKYCKRLTDEGKVSCLSASAPTINEWAYLRLEEPVLSRRIYDVEYHVKDIKFVSKKVLTVRGAHAVNNRGSTANMIKLTLQYSVSNQKSWDSSGPLKLGVKTIIQARVPEILSGTVEIQSEFTSSYNWGESLTRTDEHSTKYELTVPPKTKLTLRSLATEASFNIPFSYYQEDILTDGQKVVNKFEDGVYCGVSTYDFTYEITEENLGYDIPL